MQSVIYVTRFEIQQLPIGSRQDCKTQIFLRKKEAQKVKTKNSDTYLKQVHKQICGLPVENENV